MKFRLRRGEDVKRNDGEEETRKLREQARQSISRRRAEESPDPGGKEGTAAGQDAGEDQEDREEDKKRALGLILRRRALIRAAKRVLRARKLSLLLAAMAILLAIIFTVAVVQERMGNFTININRMEVYRQGIMLADNAKFKNPKSRLKAAAVQNATNISIDDLPADLPDIDGPHNGKDYMAYTFYVRNGGRQTIDYYSNIIIEMEAKGVSDAVRVAVYDETGKRTVYAKMAKNGRPEPGTTPFVSQKIVMEHYVRNFKVNDVDKYTVATWLEGDDPECVDAIIGGMIRLSMNIEVDKPIKDM